MGGRDGTGSAGQMQVHLGAKLRQLFDAPLDPLPERFVELLNALAAQKKERPPISSSFKSSLLALIPNLRAFAFSLCGNHEQADDLVQDTLLKAWSHMDSFQEGTNLRAWLFTILRNSFFSEMRKRRRQVEDSDGSKVDSLSVAPAQDGHVDMEDMRKALALIPADQREALILVGAAGMSYEEVAEIARCAVGTVKSRVNRARTKLAEILGVAGAQAFGPDDATTAVMGGASVRRR